MKCPGQDTQYWTAGAIFEAACPRCGLTVEFFKDDTTRKCTRCGHRFVNPRMDFGCAAYCAYAEQCLGDLPPELAAQKESLLKDRVAVAVKSHLKKDFKRIGRASRRAGHAEALGKQRPANLAVVLIAAYLWDLAANDGAAESPHALLAQLKAPETLIQQVDQIMAGTADAPGGDSLVEAVIVAEAASIALMEEAVKAGALGGTDLAEAISRNMRTEGGRAYAQDLFKDALIR
jgi:hypothetical protein